jgi:hypothetical protein
MSERFFLAPEHLKLLTTAELISRDFTMEELLQVQLD